MMPLSNVICIITQSHLSRNPRVLKEAILLAQQGYQVEIVTNVITTTLFNEDRALINPYPNIKINVVSNLAETDTIIDRLLHKLGRTLKQYVNIETPLSLGYGAHKYLKVCKAINAQLYICHQELATYVGSKLLRENRKVAFDLEDWYSDDLLPEAQKNRPVKLLRKIEDIALHKGKYCTTTSNALAAKLSQYYSAPKPAVIYNVFSKNGRLLNIEKSFSGTLKLFWFSQTIGPGRGLEQFIQASAQIKNTFELHLLGNITADYKATLNLLIPAQHSMYFHALVPAGQLAEKISEFDIGLALELDTPMSRNYTITNKYFQYIQAGLPVIASQTAGQAEAFEQFKPGFMLSQNANDEEIVRLEKWLNDPEELRAARERAIEAAGFFNWETESNKLITLVNKAIEK
jgi:glycosyltransferase involved in cell wall biosynthesis